MSRDLAAVRDRLRSLVAADPDASAELERLIAADPARRLRERDDLLRRLASQHCRGLSFSTAAKSLARSGDRFLTSRYQRIVGPFTTEPEASLAKIIELSGGRFPAQRTIRHIISTI